MSLLLGKLIQLLLIYVVVLIRTLIIYNTIKPNPEKIPNLEIELNKNVDLDGDDGRGEGGRIVAWTMLDAAWVVLQTMTGGDGGETLGQWAAWAGLFQVVGEDSIICSLLLLITGLLLVEVL